MPNRLVKETIWTSPNLNKLSDMAERHFYRILPLPDDHGCFECTPEVVRGRCYLLKHGVTSIEITQWQDELEELGIIARWNVDGRHYGVFLNFSKHQRIRSLHQRKTPTPPKEIVDKCWQMLSDDTDNPNPNLNHHPNPNRETSTDVFADEPPASPFKGGEARRRKRGEDISPAEYREKYGNQSQHA